MWYQQKTVQTEKITLSFNVNQVNVTALGYKGTESVCLSYIYSHI